MGYTHYWHQFRAFTPDEWEKITAEAKRICAKAMVGLYAGKEDFASATKCEQDDHGFRVGFNEEYAWRTFAHPEIKPATRGTGIKLVGPMGEVGTRPEFTADYIALNGVNPDESYETFRLERAPKPSEWETPAEIKKNGIFSCCKTEYRPYDPVVVSILAAAIKIAPKAITATSDGGDEAIKLMF